MGARGWEVTWRIYSSAIWGDRSDMTGRNDINKQAMERFLRLNEFYWFRVVVTSHDQKRARLVETVQALWR